MGNKSAIDWTDATWNPTTGCTKVSQGCLRTYVNETDPPPVPPRESEEPSREPFKPPRSPTATTN